MRDAERERVVVIGAGAGGLAAALDLSARGVEVIVVEKALAPGGKMRALDVGGAPVDAGPTVFTMRWVFEDLFAAAGASLEDHLTLRKASILARHAWSRKERLDLFADPDRSVEAISAFAGAAEGRRFAAFCAESKSIYDALERTFIKAQKPNPVSLVGRAGLSGLGGLAGIHPFSTMWSRLARHFHDPRLRQLFGRYATYCGSSPFLAPATLMLVAHVEQQGVWFVEGGMHRLPEAIATLASQRGAVLRYGAEVRRILVAGGRAAGVVLSSGERIEAGAVIVNADTAALPAGLFGEDAAPAAAAAPPAARSLSAVTWAIDAPTGGFPLLRHNVFFSSDYKGEFDSIFERRQIPSDPTVYVCGEDRTDEDEDRHGTPERLLVLVNAPPTGDSHPFGAAEISLCEDRTFKLLARCGLDIGRTPQASIVTTPRDFEGLFPATGGALYGRASHGWMASFQRPAARSKIPGLYLAGGSAHPGPGVPMATLSGRLAAESLMADRVSTRTFRRADTPGGTSTR